MAKKNRFDELIEKRKRLDKKKSDAFQHQIEIHRREYEDEWRTDASYFSQIGAYDWMCQSLNGLKSILEVGCGVGYSTLALATRGYQVVSVDENPYCCYAAAKLIENSKFDVTQIHRGKVNAISEDVYSQRFDPIQLGTLEKQITILDGDVIFDQNLKDWLKTVGPFDAVICWLIGTNHARQFVEDRKRLPWRNDGEYRLRVQNSSYKLADSILRVGGILNIVDRGQTPTGEKREMLILDDIASHHEQAEGTSLEVDPNSIRHLPYEHDKIKHGKKMVLTLGESSEVPDRLELSLRTISAIKK
jgi:SAM-dependent methyltransferase